MLNRELDDLEMMAAFIAGGGGSGSSPEHIAKRSVDIAVAIHAEVASRVPPDGPADPPQHDPAPEQPEA